MFVLICISETFCDVSVDAAELYAESANILTTPRLTAQDRILLLTMEARYKHSSIILECQNKRNMSLNILLFTYQTTYCVELPEDEEDCSHIDFFSFTGAVIRSVKSETTPCHNHNGKCKHSF